MSAPTQLKVRHSADTRNQCADEATILRTGYITTSPCGGGERVIKRCMRPTGLYSSRWARGNSGFRAHLYARGYMVNYTSTEVSRGTTFNPTKGTIMSKEERRNELSDSNGSGYLDGLPEPEVACTRRKALSGSFKCRCVKGAWCYAKGGKRPCDAGLLIPTHIQNAKADSCPPNQ